MGGWSASRALPPVFGCLLTDNRLVVYHCRLNLPDSSRQLLINVHLLELEAHVVGDLLKLLQLFATGFQVDRPLIAPEDILLHFGLAFAKLLHPRRDKLRVLAIAARINSQLLALQLREFFIDTIQPLHA